MTIPEALKVRNSESRLKTLRISLVRLSFRAFSARNLSQTPPGPMAQAVTFRAFGAENPEFSHSLGSGWVPTLYAMNERKRFEFRDFACEFVDRFFRGKDSIHAHHTKPHEKKR